MTQQEFRDALKGCTESLVDHPRRTASERLHCLADSEYSELPQDHYGQGGFVAELEREVAGLLGKEAAVFMPSGTMAQPIALRIWSDRAANKSVAFHPLCHLQIHEHMGYRELHHLEGYLLGEADRLFTLGDLKLLDRKLSSLLIELPQREIGGQLPTWDELQSIVCYCQENDIRLHLDGARLWECQPYYGRSYREIASGFDSVYVSFYKILGGLAGALLAGPSDFIAEARIWMRRQGGNLVGMYPNAISAKIGMDEHLHRIPDYVAKAGEIAAILRPFPGVKVVPEHPPTNMMHVYFDASLERVLDAAGKIALEEKCGLIYFAGPSDKGSKTELWIGEAALTISPERLRFLLEKFVKETSASQSA